MVTPQKLAKKKILEFLFMLFVIIEHTLTIASVLLGAYAITWLATKLGMGSSYSIILLREVSEYALLGIYIIFVFAGLWFIIHMFKDMEV
jgi:hypothetical protein